MLATHPQAVPLKGAVGVGAGEEVVGEEEEEEHRKQEQTLHGLLWTVSECVKDVNCNLFTQMERTISVCSDRNIRDQLSRWSTLTGLVISVGRIEMCVSI